MFWLRLSTIIFDPIEAITKNPIVTIQHRAFGNDGNNRCNDSVVAQQLNVANAMNAQIEKIFKYLLSPIFVFFIFLCFLSPWRNDIYINKIRCGNILLYPIDEASRIALAVG